jgi:peroxiredoxin Q/BCP
MLEIKGKMPEFELLNQDGVLVTSKNLLKEAKISGGKILIYFYPKDDTPGCTIEACGFRDFLKSFEEQNIKVIGISKDSVKSHKKFTEKYKLNFDILSDESTETIQAFGAWQEKSMYGKKYMGIARISYLFNSKGQVEKVYGKVSTKEHEHAKEILTTVK